MNLSTIEKHRLSVNHEWRVYTDDSITSTAITSRLEEELLYSGTSDIYYLGENIPTFSISFHIVLFLVENKAKIPYKFTIYHRRIKSNDQWAKWREGNKTPIEKLTKGQTIVAKGTAQRLHGNDLKAAKRARLLAKQK